MSRLTLLSTCIAAFLVGAAPPLSAQRQGLDVAAGLWLTEDTATTVVSLGHYRPLLGPIGVGVGLTHVWDTRIVNDRTLTGGLVSLTIGRDGAGPYVMGNAGFGVQHTGGGTRALWSAGAGYAMSLLPGVSAGVELQYQATDSAMGGFWNLLPSDNQGLVVQARLAIGFGGRATGRAPPPRPGPAVRPGANNRPQPRGRISDSEARRITSEVVATALRYMGTPYEWGGTDGNGFDCSGLIQFAYRREGIEIPRVSRDQARHGSAVERRIEALLPGDVLSFSAEPGGRITHVGMYVGDGEFLHSSSTGVRLSRLDQDYYMQRWVNARRMVP